MSNWARLIPPSGTLIPPSTDTNALRYPMSDGQEYTVIDLYTDRRNREGIAHSTIRHRLLIGERDIDRIFLRNPKRMPKRKPTITSTREFARKGMPL